MWHQDVQWTFACNIKKNLMQPKSLLLAGAAKLIIF